MRVLLTPEIEAMPLITHSSARIEAICARYGHDRTRLLDVCLDVQRERGQVDPEAMDAIAHSLQIPRVEVESVVTFYSFLKDRQTGKIELRLCNDVVDRLQGADEIARILQDELGIGMGETTADGAIHLEWTPCIGMSDQAPAALVNEVPVTELTPWKARWMVRELLEHADPRRLVTAIGDGNNAHPLVRAMVHNHLRRPGPVHFGPRTAEAGLDAALRRGPEGVLEEIEASGLRGRGGAGFPTGRKWRLTRQAGGGQVRLFCNADEGEPGTFKDRVLLTERPDLLFEGMTIGGYAVGAREGILYLRAEYAYLRSYLEEVLERRRGDGLLGQQIRGVRGLDFDIRIQMGAGAYVCGEETALLSSCEGHRGDPKDRPPFPVQRGYRGAPSPVNNVETFTCVARILERGAEWFRAQGREGDVGTKLFSVSGDCARPGVYELPFGTPLADLLRAAGAEAAAAVCVGGPSGTIVPPDQFTRRLGYGDLATGGAVIVFDARRDPVDLAAAYLDFFIHESCGTCTPCRVGNVLLRRRIERFRTGRASADDLHSLRETAQTIRTASRCGLGQTSPKPVLCTLEHFPDAYRRKLAGGNGNADRVVPAFDPVAALDEARIVAGRDSVLFPSERGGRR